MAAGPDIVFGQTLQDEPGVRLGEHRCGPDDLLRREVSAGVTSYYDDIGTLTVVTQLPTHIFRCDF